MVSVLTYSHRHNKATQQKEIADMSYINPGLYGHDSTAVQRQLRSMERETIAQARAEASMADAFTRAAIAGDMTAPAYFAPRDYRGRLQTVGAVMAESLDYGNGPSMDDAMRLIAAAAAGADVADMARSLVNRMADAYAHYNAEVQP